MEEDFSSYTHIESDVVAEQSTPETQGFLAATLMNELALDTLHSLTCSTDPVSKSTTITFRYKNDSKPQVLAENDYLIRLNVGTYKVCPQAEFEAYYIHSELDPVLAKTKSIKQALVDLAAKNYTSLKITTVGDLTETKLIELVEAMKATCYRDNKFYFDFSDCGITEAYGLTDVVAAFTQASYVNNETTFVFKFNNGTVTSPDSAANNLPNLFTYIGLETLIGEFDHMSRDLYKHPIEIQLVAENSATSPIAPSVTSKHWEDFSSSIKSIAGDGAAVTILRS